MRFKSVLIAAFLIGSTAFAANVIKKVANADGTYTYRESVNTPDFLTADWWIDPTGVDTLKTDRVLRKYWKPDGLGGAVEMSAGEKTVVDTPKTPTGDIIYLKSADGGIFKLGSTNAGALTLTKIN